MLWLPGAGDWWADCFQMLWLLGALEIFGVVGGLFSDYLVAKIGSGLGEWGWRVESVLIVWLRGKTGCWSILKFCLNRYEWAGVVGERMFRFVGCGWGVVSGACLDLVAVTGKW